MLYPKQDATEFKHANRHTTDLIIMNNNLTTERDAGIKKELTNSKVNCIYISMLEIIKALIHALGGKSQNPYYGQSLYTEAAYILTEACLRTVKNNYDIVVVTWSFTRRQIDSNALDWFLRVMQHTSHAHNGKLTSTIFFDDLHQNEYSAVIQTGTETGFWARQTMFDTLNRQVRHKSLHESLRRFANIHTIIDGRIALRKKLERDNTEQIRQSVKNEKPCMRCRLL